VSDFLLLLVIFLNPEVDFDQTTLLIPNRLGHYGVNRLSIVFVNARRRTYEEIH
jgi:hypothetical protein